jgi:hypothetical protein
MFIMIAVVFSEHLHPERDFPNHKVNNLMNKTTHITFILSQVCGIFSCSTVNMLYGITWFC